MLRQLRNRFALLCIGLTKTIATVIAVLVVLAAILLFSTLVVSLSVIPLLAAIRVARWLGWL